MKERIYVNLCKNHARNDKDYYAQINSSRVKTKENIISMILRRRTELREETISSSLSLFNEMAMEQLLQGKTVNYGLFKLSLSVKGNFTINDSWDPKNHHFELNVKPSNEFRNQLQTIEGRFTSKSSNIFISSVKDNHTGSCNKYLTPGRTIEIKGKTIKIDGDDPSVGLFLQNVDTNAEIRIPQNEIVENYPKKLLAMLPETLEPGNYRIVIRTQLTVGNKATKGVKSCQTESLAVVQP